MLSADENSQVQALARSSSGINRVERWCGFTTDQLIRRGSHRSVHALEGDEPATQRAIHALDGDHF